MSKLPVFVILDIDNTLLSSCRRFSPSYPFVASQAEQVLLRYYDYERGQEVENRTLTLRPYLSEFLRVTSGALSSSRVDVRVCLFTHNTESYARAVAAHVVCPRLSAPLALCRGSSDCVFEQRQKSISAVTRAGTALLLDDNCESFVPAEFFSGRGALVPSFFSGQRPWSPEDEMDDVLSCAHEAGESVSLCALVEGFVEFWHCNGGDGEEEKVNLLKDTRAHAYRQRWHRYHEPMEERLHCIL